MAVMQLRKVAQFSQKAGYCAQSAAFEVFES